MMGKADILSTGAAPLLNISMIALLEQAAEAVPERIFIKQPAEGHAEELTWTYAGFLADVRRLSAYLAQFFDRGDRVGIWAANSGAWFLYQFAASHLGLVLVPLNPAMRREELAHMLTATQSRGIVMERSFRGADMVSIFDEARPVVTTLKTVLHLDEWRQHLADAPEGCPFSTTGPEDPALIVFTSGTTGKPKGAVLRQGACVDNGKAGADRSGLPDGAVWLATLPVFHCGGPVTICLGVLSKLGTMVIMPPFDPATILKLIERERINWAPLVPAMLIPMVEHDDFRRTDLSSLKVLLFGGTTLTPDFLRMAHEKTGATVQVVFGMTEGAGTILMTEQGDPTQIVSTTVGRPLPHVDLRIVAPSTEETLDVGEVGEIRYRSPYMTAGYFGDNYATDALFDRHGYLRTGDLGMIDADGRVRVTGRLKDLIIRSGMNIYPREVEDALAAYPGVAESAAVGVPHDVFGEEVGIAVSANSGSTLDVQEMRAFLLARLARYKVPKHWRVVDTFPRTAFGKIQKFELIRLFKH